MKPVCFLQQICFVLFFHINQKNLSVSMKSCLLKWCSKTAPTSSTFGDSTLTAINNPALRFCCYSSILAIRSTSEALESPSKSHLSSHVAKKQE